MEATVKAAPGSLFEQWVGTQLQRRVAFLGSGSLGYYRTTDGAEGNFIIERNDTLIPIEAKWSGNPGLKDDSHLKAFIAAHPARCDRG